MTMKMNVMTFIILLAVSTSSWCLQRRYKREALAIMKRMAEDNFGFEGHDLARVHLAEAQGQQKRRLTKRDLRSIGDSYTDKAKRNLHLELSSGSNLKLAVRSAGIVDSDTAISYRTSNDNTVTKRGADDCYAHGELKDSSGGGLAAISHCDGLFGFASTDGYEYFFHPVGTGERSKRETSTGAYDVHVMWRRSAAKKSTNNSTDSSEYGDDYIIALAHSKASRFRRSEMNIDNAGRIVVELAVFSDAEYWQLLQRVYPGREDDYLLTRLAGAQALYSDYSKVGYDVQIKLKFLEYWVSNPDEYTFKDEFPNNLRSFCQHTTEKYFYDVHLLNTGIKAWNNGQVGLAYVGDACTVNRCAATKGTGIDTFKLYAHELGHVLGMTHFQACPADLKEIGGFMGGGYSLNFSPCMKHQLGAFLKKDKSKCLLEETIEASTPTEFNELRNAFPGQLKSADELCLLLAGSGYNYVPNENRYDSSICNKFVCLNEDDNSSEYGRVKHFKTPIGFPCDHESFCKENNNCHLWNETVTSLDIESLRKFIAPPQWAEWSREVHHCSRLCGTGVRTRHRKCRYENLSLAPYCPEMSVKTQLCNTEPCPEEPTGFSKLRNLRGDEVCQRLLQDVVEVSTTTQNMLTTSSTASPGNGEITPIIHGQSCTMKCRYTQGEQRVDVDAFLPDGTVCGQTERSEIDLIRFNIDLRCVQGVCLEFTDCPEESQSKDKCGVCGGDGTSCEEDVDQDIMMI